MTKKVLLIAAAILLTVALYLAPKKNLTTTAPPNPREASSDSDHDNFEMLLSDAKSSLKRQELETITSLEERVKKEPGNLLMLDSLARRWDAFQIPAISAHYFEMIAIQKPEEKSWLNAAYRHFDAFKIAGDSALRAMMVQKAITDYENVLKLNPDNLNAKTDLGICYAEGTGDPMKGIMMLREVVKKDSLHENAQFNLGILSMRSGQYEKAIERFENVLSINPARKELYLFTGRAYMMAGKNDKAKEYFERLKKETSDPALTAQADNYINQIK